MIDILLYISSWLHATEAYITSQQETERVHHIVGATQLTDAEGSTRSSNLPATSLPKMPLLMSQRRSERGS